MIRRLVLIVIMVARGKHPTRDGASRPRPESTSEFPHPPLLLLLLNE
jgi:tRNA U38,U39,U40 pseudouridine synthase TruA